MLKIQNVTKYYGNYCALNDISFEVPKGSVYGLLGHNGAGKTTLIRMITQITAPDKGNIFLNDQQLNRSHISLIGYLPEERGLYKKMKVKEHLLYLAMLREFSKKEALLKIHYWLEKLEIIDWQNSPIEDLSKGMQQKIQFIATVLHDPKLLILDEPFSGFDPVNVALIKKEIIELKEKGVTIIFSTHNMEFVEELCDEITMINRSKNVLTGTVQQIKENHKKAIYSVKIKTKTIKLYIGTIISQKKKNDLIELDIELLNDQIGANQLLKTLMEQGEIISFQEKLPSINDIFLKNVKPFVHEKN